MANPEHLEMLLKQRVEDWNQWRGENLEVELDFSRADLKTVELSTAYLERVNLEGANLKGANLRSADLKGANLKGANLKKAIFECANLEGACLEEANLEEANLEGANLEGVKFVKANLRRANLNEVNYWGNSDFERADFSEADLKEANLKGANLERAFFMNAKMEKANLERINLEGAWLEGACLEEANLEGANLKETDLEKVKLIRANLREANLREANLKGVDFRGANLYGVNLRGFNLIEVDFTEADLTEADLTEANLAEANLEGANLTRTKNLETNFQKAILTGACIEDWSINMETNLKNIKCDYIFFRYQWSEQKREYIFTERRPHQEEKFFEPRDFERLVRKAQETVDLIFSNGIDWKAFSQSFQVLKEQYGDKNLSIQAIENKKDRAFLVRLEVDSGADKAEIESAAIELYETKLKLLEAEMALQTKLLTAKEEQIIDLRHSNASLEKIASVLAASQGNSIVIGNVTGNVSGIAAGKNIAGVAGENIEGQFQSVQGDSNKTD